MLTKLVFIPASAVALVGLMASADRDLTAPAACDVGNLRSRSEDMLVLDHPDARVVVWRESSGDLKAYVGVNGALGITARWHLADNRLSVFRGKDGSEVRNVTVRNPMTLDRMGLLAYHGWRAASGARSVCCCTIGGSRIVGYVSIQCGGGDNSFCCCEVGPCSKPS